MAAQLADESRFATSDLSHGEVTAEIDDITRPGITNQEVMKIYVKWAENYDEHQATVNTKRFDQTIKEVKTLGIKPNDSRIMDIACGTGLLGEELAPIGFTNIDGLDGSQEMLDKAKEKNIYRNLIATMFGADPVEGIEKDSYDLSIALGCFTVGHLEADAMQEIVRITKPGGHVIMTMSDHSLASPAGYEKAIDTLAEEGKWKLVSKNRFTVYDTMDGYAFTLQVL